MKLNFIGTLCESGCMCSIKVLLIKVRQRVQKSASKNIVKNRQRFKQSTNSVPWTRQTRKTGTTQVNQRDSDDNEYGFGTTVKKSRSNAGTWEHRDMLSVTGASWESQLWAVDAGARGPAAGTGMTKPILLKHLCCILFRNLLNPQTFTISFSFAVSPARTLQTWSVKRPELENCQEWKYLQVIKDLFHNPLQKQ